MSSIYNYPYQVITEEYLKTLDFNDKTVISYGVNGYTTCLKKLCSKVLVVVKDDVDASILDGVELLRTPSILGDDAVLEMARDMALYMENSVLFDYIDNKTISSIIFKRLKNDLTIENNYYVEFLSSSELNGFSKLIKLKLDGNVYGINLKDYNDDAVDKDLIDDIYNSLPANLDSSLVIKM